MILFAGSYTAATGGSEGIRAYRLDAGTGSLDLLATTGDAPEASFLAVHPSGRVLYAAHELGEWDGRAEGALSVYAVEAGTGRLALRARLGTGGAHPCHVSVHPSGRALYVANYGGGSVAAWALDGEGLPAGDPEIRRHAGRGPDPDRQAGPHAHSVTPDPSGRWLLAADLGCDRVFAYRLGTHPAALPEPPVPSVLPPGRGPRHLAFRPDGRAAWLAQELAPLLSACAFDGETGALRIVQDTDPGVPGGERPYPAELRLHPSGRLLVASVRGPDVLVPCRVAADGGLVPGKPVPAGAAWPRHFAFAPGGRFLVAAGQRGNRLAVFSVDAEADPAGAGEAPLAPLPGGAALPAPACVAFLP